jgi:hypothetical protein
MKKLTLFISILTGSFFIFSCDKKEESNENNITCKQCKITSTNNVTHETRSDSAEEKCGFDLINVLKESPVTIGDVTTKWECK